MCASDRPAADCQTGVTGQCSVPPPTVHVRASELLLPQVRYGLSVRACADVTAACNCAMEIIVYAP